MNEDRERRITDRRKQPFDVVQRAKHYNSHPSGVEVKEITNFLEFNLGNFFRYVICFKEKEPLRSLKSAMWYLDEHRRMRMTAGPKLSAYFEAQVVLLRLTTEYHEAQQALTDMIKSEPDELVKLLLADFQAYWSGYDLAFGSIRVDLQALITQQEILDLPPTPKTSPEAV